MLYIQMNEISLSQRQTCAWFIQSPRERDLLEIGAGLQQWDCAKPMRPEGSGLNSDKAGERGGCWGWTGQQPLAVNL